MRSSTRGRSRSREVFHVIANRGDDDSHDDDKEEEEEEHELFDEPYWGRGLARSRSEPWLPAAVTGKPLGEPDDTISADTEDSLAAERWLSLPPRLQHLLSYLWSTWGDAVLDMFSMYVHVCTQTDEPTGQVRVVQIHSGCYLVLACVALLFMTHYLQGMLLPVLFAAGIAVLLEPIVFLFVDVWVRCFTPKRLRPGLHGSLQGGGQAPGSPVAESQLLQSWACSVGVGASPGGSFSRDVATKQGQAVLWLVIMRAWCVLVVGLVVMALVAVAGSIVVWVVTSFQTMDWGKYLQGERVGMLRNQLAAMGVKDFESSVKKGVSFLIRAAGLEILGSTMSFLTSLLLMVLFLAFFLIDSAFERAAGKEPWRNRQKRLVEDMRRIFAQMNSDESFMHVNDDIQPLASTLSGSLRVQMRTYIKAKFWLSVIKAIAIGTMFVILNIDLWLLWTALTFVLNFVPLGSSISTFAPVPIVALDPNQGLLTVTICILFPLLVHNVVGNVVEPRIFASTLSLHPITVLLALTFWTAVWGILGALVCVPITAMLRVILEALQSHPYVRPILRLLEGEVHAEESEGRCAYELLVDHRRLTKET